ncbi:alpha-2-HS-glycoprotein [Tiliqua scincoides]|uniref:alpha-2-HS-glycoprotein n=1 Tax=Tiliqua scincoides TaxID=71010 RepID=UPI0034637151
MKFLVALVLLAQLLSCKAIPLLPELVPRIINCDDQEAEEAALVARDYINGHNLHGYKYELNRIEKIKVLPRRPFGEIFFLELDFLETGCPVISPVPVENCTVRQRHEHAVEGDCDVKLLKLDGKLTVLSTKCHSTPDSAEDLVRLCPDCPQLVNLNDASVVHAVDVALAQYNANNASCYYKILEITRARSSFMPVGVHAEFVIVGTNCTAQQAKEHVENCHVEKGEHAHSGFCKASFIKVPEISADGLKQVNSTQVTCEIYDHQPGLSHTHLTVHHLGGNRPSPGVGFKVLDLRHSHNDTHASHESHSAEIPAPPPAPVVKRSVYRFRLAQNSAPSQWRRYRGVARNHR